MEQIDKSDTIKLQTAIAQMRSIAQQYQGNANKLLDILRQLEQLHSDIYDDLFQPALPNSRHALFDLLRDIETNGGWPYIYRIGLQELFQSLTDPEPEIETNIHPQKD